MKLNLGNKCDLSWFYSFGDDAIMVGPVFDVDVLGACEVTFEVDDFKILNVKVEKIGLLLINYRIFFTYFDSWIYLSDLLFV